MATTIVKTEKLSGQRLRRKEDPRLITGTATYVDDLKMPGMHHACIVRSPHAAARIRSINTQPALDRPGVVADPEKALATGAPAVHPEWPANVAFNYHQEGGEPEKAFAEAEVVIKQRI